MIAFPHRRAGPIRYEKTGPVPLLPRGRREGEPGKGQLARRGMPHSATGNRGRRVTSRTGYTFRILYDRRSDPTDRKIRE